MWRNHLILLLAVFSTILIQENEKKEIEIKGYEDQLTRSEKLSGQTVEYTAKIHNLNSSEVLRRGEQ